MESRFTRLFRSPKNLPKQQMLEQVTTSLAKYPSLDSRPNYKSDVSHSFAQIFLESRKQQPNYLKLC
jgi:hypothetical protein